MIGQCKLCLTAGVELQDRHFLSVGIYRILTTAADQYIVSRGDQKSVIAGYHWFGDWGRDTMIALPGLTLPTGRFDIARSILRTFRKTLIRACCRTVFPMLDRRPSTTPSMRHCGSSKPFAPTMPIPVIWHLFNRSYTRFSPTSSIGMFVTLATE